MTGRPTIAYQPALDAVRALAVIAVLLFHADVPGFRGGYLGVSVFFTLSGFLITSLLVTEHDTTRERRGVGRIALARFYSRRLRRLLPASLLCLLAIVLLAAWTDVFDGAESLRGDVLGALFQVSNWVFLAGEGSYQDLLADTTGMPSPVEHFWSLSIEEQFYWLWPPVMVLVLGRARTRRARITAIGGLTLAFAAAAPVIAAVWGPDAAYWASPARVSEILFGALLAVAVSGRDVDRRWQFAAPAALVALAAAVVLFPTAGGPAYNGALPLVGVASATLLLGLQVPSPLRQAMSISPLVWLGKISYGVYLYHWPIFLILTADRTGLDGVLLVAVRLAATLAVSVVSYHVVELPIRHATRLGKRPTFAGALVGTAAVCAVALAIAPAGLGQYWLADDEAVEAAAIEVDDRELAPLGGDAAGATGTTVVDTTTTTTPPTTAPSASEAVSSTSVASTTTSTTTTTTIPDWSVEPLGPLPELSRPVRIVVVGDSTADAFGAGVVTWAAQNPELAQAQVVVRLGCGALMGGERLEGTEFRVEPACERWIERFVYPEVRRLSPDVVMLLTTGWDVLDHRWEDGVQRSPFDPVFVERLEADYLAAIDGLIEAGATHVALVRPPIADPYWLPEVHDQEDPARYAILYEMFDRIADQHPRTVAIVPLNTWFTAAGIDRDVDIRPDGVHVTPEAALQITEEFLGDRLVRVALELPLR